MNTDRIRVLRQERTNLAKQMHDMLNVASSESRGLNAEEDSRWSQLNADVDAKAKDIERLERDDQLEVELRSAAKAPEAALTPAAQEGDAPNVRTLNRAVRSWAARGAAALDDGQRKILRWGQPSDLPYGGDMITIRAPRPGELEERAQSTAGQVGAATGTAGGDIVAPLFYQQLTEAMKWYGGMRQAPCTVITTDTGATLQMPTVNDTGSVGRILGENAQVTETDFVFSQKVLSAYIFSSDSVLVPMTLMQDSAFPLDAFIARKLGERIGRLQNTKFTVGSGTNEPTGVVTSATLGTTGATGKVGAFQYADLVNLLHSIDPAYRNPNTARWMMSDAALSVLRTMVDGNNRPLWQPYGVSGLGGGFQDTLLGYQYQLNQDVPAPAVSAKSLLFGDFSTYYIRDVADVTVLRLTERYADYLSVGFIAFARADGTTLDAGMHPIQYFAGAAT